MSNLRIVKTMESPIKKLHAMRRLFDKIMEIKLFLMRDEEGLIFMLQTESVKLVDLWPFGEYFLDQFVWSGWSNCFFFLNFFSCI